MPGRAELGGGCWTLRSPEGCGQTAAPTRPPVAPQCPWTVGLWCCRPSGTCPGARARRRTRACWSCRAPCAPSTTCSSAPSSAAAPATASAWTAACAAPSRTAPCRGGPRGPPAPTPAQPPRPRPPWEPPRLPAAATGWRAGRPGWDPASRSCGGGSPGEAAPEAAGPLRPLPPAPLLAASATAQVPSRRHRRLGTGPPIRLSRRPPLLLLPRSHSDPGIATSSDTGEHAPPLHTQPRGSGEGRSGS